MIYSIKYKRTIGDNVHEKTATFITKEMDERQVYFRWIKNHTMDFIKSIQLVSIAEKYPKRIDSLDSKRARLGMFISTPDDSHDCSKEQYYDSANKCSVCCVCGKKKYI